MLEGRGRERDAPRRGNAFDTRGEIDAIAEYVAFLNDHIAEMDADAQLQWLSVHAALNLHRAGHSIHNARKLSQDTIASCLEDAALMFGNFRVDGLDTEGFERLQGSSFILAHE